MDIKQEVEEAEAEHKQWDTEQLVGDARALIAKAITDGIPKRTRKITYLEIKKNGEWVATGERKIEEQVIVFPDVKMAATVLDRHDQLNFRRPELIQQLELFKQKETNDDGDSDDDDGAVVILPNNNRD